MPKTTIIHKDTDLTEVHTFGVLWKANYFVVLESEQDIPNLVSFAKEKNMPMFVLGGGSNILPTKKFQGLVIQNSITGVEVVKETKTHTYLSVGAGEEWDRVVRWSIKNNMFGFENLSLIPGSVGGAVVQNIGAYDVDIARYVQSVTVYSLKTGLRKTYSSLECKFSYRSSVFKSNSKWVVTSVTFRLPKRFAPVLTYKGLQHLQNKTNLTAKEVAQTVIEERNKKLPNPKDTGTAGSFFKNPRVSASLARTIKQEYPEVPLFRNYGQKTQTIPAGWLIQQTVSAKTKKDFLYPKHNLVVVNVLKGENQKTNRGLQILHATQKIQKQVQQKFGILLEPEVIIL